MSEVGDIYVYLEVVMVEMSALAATIGVVLGEGHLTSFNIFEVLYEDVIMPLHLLGCFTTHCTGNLLPAVGGVLVVHGQCSLKRLVL